VPIEKQACFDPEDEELDAYVVKPPRKPSPYEN
jgi:hypothetical protein